MTNSEMLYAIGLLVLYFLPWLNALGRGHLNSTPILLVNLFFGWTLLGWVIALIWSATDHVYKKQRT